MKKLIGLIVMMLIFDSPVFAGFNYGVDTYTTDGGTLIVNSLGDQSSISTFGSLGTNDFIPENAVKNYLKMEGYTTAIDYNPSVTNPQFSSAYNQSVPAGYTKLTFAGLLGNPRATQDVYVQTIEYNRLNSEMQAQQILANATEISDTSDRLGIDINNANDARQNGDDVLQQNIDSEAMIRYDADQELADNIRDEESLRTTADNTLQSNIDTEEDNRIQADVDEIEARVNGDKRVQDNLDAESSTRYNSDQNLQKNIDNTNSRIDSTNKRVSTLENTQAVVGAEVRIYDGKKWTVTTFADYITTRNTVDRAGVRFTYKMGTSYEERRQNELEARLNKLEGVQNEKQNLSNSEMYTTSNGSGIRTKF